MTYNSLDQVRDALVNFGRYLAERGLAWASSGNMSARISDVGCVMTATGSRLGQLSHPDLPEVDFSKDPVHKDEFATRRPSKEVNMHVAMYRARPEWRAAVHVSPRYTTLLACAGVLPPADLSPEGMMQLQQMVRVPYAHAGSSDLAGNVQEAAAHGDVLLLENHGIIVGSETLDDAVLKVEVFEFTASLYVTARQAGLELNHLSPEQVAAFRSSNYKR